jgi:hypothetical protein
MQTTMRSAPQHDDHPDPCDCTPEHTPHHRQHTARGYEDLMESGALQSRAPRGGWLRLEQQHVVRSIPCKVQGGYVRLLDQHNSLSLTSRTQVLGGKQRSTTTHHAICSAMEIALETLLPSLPVGACMHALVRRPTHHCPRGRAGWQHAGAGSAWHPVQQGWRSHTGRRGGG